MALYKYPTIEKVKMSRVKSLRLKTSPTNLLFREFFSFQVNYMNPIELPTFPSKFQIKSSEIKSNFNKISAFAISKYLLEDLKNFSPKNMLRSLIDLPKHLFVTILQARSKFK